MGVTLKVRKPKQLTNRTLADKLANRIGSWAFIGSQAFILSLWITINAYGAPKWDPPPFILLNLLLSFQAAFTGPVLLMAANRQSDLDRRRSVDHYMIDLHDSQILEEMAAQLQDIHKHVDQVDEEHW